MEITPAQTIGPFFRFALPFERGPRLVPDGHPGAVRVAGRVLDGAGEPVPDALIEVWQAGPDGTYGRTPGFHGFGRCPTDAAGRYAFVTVKPGAVAPHAPCLNLTVFARGLLRHLVTRVYFPDEAAANAADPVLAAITDTARRATLVAAPGDGGPVFDIRLQGGRETVFFGD